MGVPEENGSQGGGERQERQGATTRPPPRRTRASVHDGHAHGRLHPGGRGASEVEGGGVPPNESRGTGDLPRAGADGGLPHTPPGILQSGHQMVRVRPGTDRHPHVAHPGHRRAHLAPHGSLGRRQQDMRIRDPGTSRDDPRPGPELQRGPALVRAHPAVRDPRQGSDERSQGAPQGRHHRGSPARLPQVLLQDIRVRRRDDLTRVRLPAKCPEKEYERPRCCFGVN